jgi:hypothetical protein
MFRNSQKNKFSVNNPVERLSKLLIDFRSVASQASLRLLAMLLNLSAFAFTILLPLSSAQAAETKAFLHYPWSVLQSQLNRNSSSSSTPSAGDNGSVLHPSSSTLGSTFHASPSDVGIDVAGLHWNVSGISIDGRSTANINHLGPSSALLSVTQAEVHATIANISVDQTVVSQIGGATVNVHFQASCGPIHLHQLQANALAQFALDWRTGVPAASLAALTLSWPSNSWTVDDFTCTGPSGLPDQLHSKIVDYVRDPQDFKPQIEAALSENVSKVLNQQLGILSQTILVKTNQTSITINAGQLLPTDTGVLIDLSVNALDPHHLLPPNPVPQPNLMASLPADRPAFIGGMDMIEDMLDRELAAQPEYTKVNLQTIKAFHDIIHNRFIQLFVWLDLWNYPMNYPFFLRAQTPRGLKFSAVTSGPGKGLLQTKFDTRAVVQSYRDKVWWSYLQVSGDASADVKVNVVKGQFTYSTTISSTNISITYGAAYKKRYSPGSFPASDIVASVKGQQSALSGSMTWPQVDFGNGSIYQAAGLTWFDAKTFIMPWNLIN